MRINLLWLLRFPAVFNEDKDKASEPFCGHVVKDSDQHLPAVAMPVEVIDCYKRIGNEIKHNYYIQIE